MPGRTEDDLPIALDDPRFKRIQALRERVEIEDALILRSKQRQFFKLFPDETRHDPVTRQTFHARSLYPKHLEFFRAGATHRERAFIAGNRTGKTVAGGFEAACHLTGRYPSWWEGKRFPRPIRAYAAGKTSETTREIVQAKLLGEVLGSGPTKHLSGTGIIPGEALGDRTWKSGVPDLVDHVKVRHVSGGWSTLWLKSYEQGRGIFEGTELEFLWFDEEPPIDVYEEGLIRTTTTGGLVMLTFTPLAGWTETVEQFLGTPDDEEAA